MSVSLSKAADLSCWSVAVQKPCGGHLVIGAYPFQSIAEHVATTLGHLFKKQNFVSLYFPGRLQRSVDEFDQNELNRLCRVMYLVNNLFF